MPRARFDCRCGMPAEFLTLWFDDDLGGLPGAEGDMEITIGTPTQAWIHQRIREAWKVLRGERAVYGSVMIDAKDAAAMRDVLGEYIERAHQQEQKAA